MYQTSILMQKRALRKEMLQKRRRIFQHSKLFQDEASKIQMKKFLVSLLLECYGKFLHPNGAKRKEFRSIMVSGYLPINSEFDCSELLEIVHKLGHRCCIPIVTNSNSPLSFREWKPSDGSNVQESYRLVPESDRSNFIDVTPDLLLIPLLAYDRFGNRLGYGGGYYDRTLRYMIPPTSLQERQHHPMSYPTISCGVCFYDQILDFLPTTDSDQPIDYLLTERGLTCFRNIKSKTL